MFVSLKAETAFFSSPTQTQFGEKAGSAQGFTGNALGALSAMGVKSLRSQICSNSMMSDLDETGRRTRWQRRWRSR